MDVHEFCVNYGPLLQDLGIQLQNDLKPVPQRRLVSTPCLPERLPSSSFIEREAQMLAPKAMLRQLRCSPTPPPTEESFEEEPAPTVSPSRGTSALSFPSSSLAASTLPIAPSSSSSTWTEPQPFEVFRAVEKKDITFLMEIRDRAFPLLLRKSGNATPLLHAMRIGQSHRDVAIVLLGAFSRWINHLDDEDIPKPRTKVILKALRVNLKLAIDFGLSQSQNDLTASFMQTLIMSEGDKWIWSQVSLISRALCLGAEGKPVKAAEAAVRRFATKELGKAHLIATLEDYVANATGDLLMLSAWSLALESISAPHIPSYYFARDDRVHRAFVSRLDGHSSAIRERLGKRLKWQMRVLRAVLGGRTTTYHRKIEILASELDEGEGV